MAIVNPEWEVKEIGSIQSAQEINDIVLAVKNNADELQLLKDNYVNSLIKVNNKPLTGDLILDKTDIGLPNVDNTSDINKPISDPVKNALNNKVDNTIKINGYQLNQDITIFKTDIGLTNVDNTSDINKPVSNALASAIGSVNANINTHKNDIENPHNVTKAQIGLLNVDNTSDNNKPISIVQLNALNLKADLIDGKIPSEQLPSYVDDVLEFTGFTSFPLIGEEGKIYVALDSNLIYRWTGSSYIEISKSLALGETSLSAYPGDKGKLNADNLLTLSTKGYLFLGYATTSTNPSIYSINDRVYYILDMPSSATQVRLSGFNNIIIPILTERTRYIILWNGNSWVSLADNTFATTNDVNIINSNLYNIKVNKSTLVIAGSGLTGGGTLESDKTINVVSSNDGITINADNITLNSVNDLVTTSTTKPLSANLGKILNDNITQIGADLNMESLSNKVLLDKSYTTITNTALTTLHLTGSNNYQNNFSDSRYVKSGSILHLKFASLSYSGHVNICTVLTKAAMGESFFNGEIKSGQLIDLSILTTQDCYGYIIHEMDGGTAGDITLQLDRLDYSTTLAKQSDVSLLDKSLSSNINLTGLSSDVFSTTTKLLDFKFKKGDKYVITTSNIVGSGEFGIYTSISLSSLTNILKGTKIKLGFNKLIWTVPFDVDVLYGYSTGDISLDLSFTLYSVEQTDYQLRKSNYDLIGQDFPAINLVDIGQNIINPSDCCDLVLRSGRGVIINNPYTNIGKAIKCSGTGSSSSRTYDGLTIGNTYTIIAICSDTNSDYGYSTNTKVYTDGGEVLLDKVPFLYKGKNIILAYNTFTAVATSKVALYTTYTNGNELYAELLINGSDISSIIPNLDNIINNYNYYNKTYDVNLADLSKTVSVLNYKPIYTNIATNKQIITGIGIDNNGYHYTNANVSIARIPVKSDTVYSIFNHFVETVYKRVTFLDSNLAQLGVGNAYIEMPHAADYTFATKATYANYYGERLYVKTPSSAAFIEIEIYNGMDVSKLGVYEGLFYKDPKNAQAKDFSNNKLNVLLLGDSYWEDAGGIYDGRVLSNNLRGLIGINYIMNLAQGGGRLIHSDTTTDITSDVTYDNVDAQNVYSNQFLKYKFRHEASPTNYPIPDAIFICGVTNNLSFYPTQFDSSEYDSVWANTFSGTLNELKFAGAFRGLIKRITDYLGYNIPIYVIGTVTHPSINYSIRMINEQFRIASSSHGIPFIDPSGCNCSYLNSSIWRDGTHPNNIGAPIMANEVARILIEQYEWNDCR